MLIMRFSALGDVAMTIPVIYSFASQYPDIAIHVATNGFMSGLFLSHPSNVYVHKFDLQEDYKGIIGILKLYRILAKWQPDIIVDLHNVPRTWIVDIFFWMKGKKVGVVDKKRFSRNSVIKKKITHPSFFKRYKDVFRRLGFDFNLNFKSLFAEEDGKTKPVFSPAVGIAPFARYRNKTLPEDVLNQLIHEFTINRGIKVYLFGGHGVEAEKLEQISKGYPLCFSIAGKYSLEKEIKLISKLNMMISMDSANQHIASLTGIPVITIWGGTTPSCGFAPYKQPIENDVCLNITCQPCTIAGSNFCKTGDFKCLCNISSEMIIKKVERILEYNCKEI